MGHDHQHHSRTEFYVEQLFTIGICGAFGIVAVRMFMTNQLGLMLVPFFHPYVAAGGLLLLAMVVIRAAAVWQTVAEPVAVPAHNHDHDHEHCDHDHAHEHGHCEHDHAHDHGHAHEHDHGHKHDHGDEHAHLHEQGQPHEHAHAPGHGHDHGHDHGWAPWRYVVLMLPIVLFLLGLPNDGFSSAHGGKQDLTGLKVEGKVASRGVLKNVGFQELEKAAFEPDTRELMEGKQISLIGRFIGDDPKRFSLTRYQMKCCAADAVPLNAVIMIDPNPKVPGVDLQKLRNKWLQVTGLVYFLKRGGDKGEYVSSIVIQPKDGQKLSDFIEIVPAPGNQFLN